MLIHELPKLSLDANDIEDFKKWMEFVQKNPESLQEKDAQMALMIEKKRGRAVAKDQKKKLKLDS
jgi:transposase